LSGGSRSAQLIKNRKSSINNFFMPFACIFVPDFPVEAVVRAEPELREQAVAVVEGMPPLVHVVAVNGCARQAGVEPGMTKLEAEARFSAMKLRAGACGWQLKRRSAAQETAAHAALVDCAHAFSPRVEASGSVPDTVIVDLAGLERLFGAAPKIARELARRASDMGLEASVAVAETAEAAICAAQGFCGVTVIPAGKESERLGALPIDVLLNAARPGQADEMHTERVREILETLDRWGVRTFRAFAALPETAVAERLGDCGIRLQKLARGEGEGPLVPREAPLTFEEAIDLEHPVEMLEPLAFILSRLLEQLCARLGARALSTNELRLRLELEPCGAISTIDADNKTGSRPGNVGRDTVYERTLRLPVPMLDAKVFLRLWQLELRAHPPEAPVTKILVAAEPVRPRAAQGGLFLPSAPEPERLGITLARIAGVIEKGEKQIPRCGSDDSTSSIAPNGEGEASARRVGAAELVDTHRAGAFRMKRFVPPQETDTVKQIPRCARDDKERDKAQSRQATVTALRRFRPPVQVKVQMRDGRPLRIMANGAGTMVSAGEVTWCAGPWRTSSEWWSEQTWSRETWDVAVRSEGRVVLYRIFCDLQSDAWLLEGSYD
jgi:protein ImuB